VCNLYYIEMLARERADEVERESRRALMFRLNGRPKRQRTSLWRSGLRALSGLTSFNRGNSPFSVFPAERGVEACC
jgi:hypothetical protein